MDKNKIFTVANAHLDTVWRWDLKKTIEEYLPDTLEKNFYLFKKYPDYKFNFEGAYRYELIEEYYPSYFNELKHYIDEGKWNVCGSSYESNDVNIPSPESIIRNFLYGNEYFKTKFGKKSTDVFLPDCFGFGYALPTIANHCNLKGFTTQKLTWGCAYPIPFDIGVWKGIDSSSIYACLNAQSYRYKFNDDVRGDINIINKISDNANKNNLPWTLSLYGDGDFGGAPDEESVYNVCKSSNIKNDHTEVLISSADDIYNSLDKLDNNIKNRLSIWNNELVMTNHGVGAYTSRGMSKRLNSKNEIMADICEKGCVLANCLCNNKYPHKIIDSAWKRIIKHQFHDDITGTSSMEVYNDSWNDYYVSINQFKNEYESSVHEIAKKLNTSWIKECGIIVNNPTTFESTQAVKAHIKLKHNTKFIKIFDVKGNEIPCQIVDKNGKEFDIIFLATVSGNGYKVYDARCSDKPCNLKSDLHITEHSLENKNYKVLLNKNGDIASIIDKNLKVQLLSSPIKLALLHNIGALDYPSWELRKDDLDKSPYGYANSPTFKIIDNGPARISIEVERQLGNYSIVKQIISLDSQSEYVNIYNYVDWNERRSLLKAQFPFTCRNKLASYDLGVGFIKRPNNSIDLYEVPAQKWADISDDFNQYGVSILSDCKYGWDKPNDNTLRLSCIHTPTGAYSNDARQDLQDIGRNIFSFAIYSHKSNNLANTQIVSETFNKPMLAFQTNCKNETKLDDLSLVKINNKNIIIKAIKKSQDDKTIIVRLNEISGEEQKNIQISFLNKIKKASEVYGNEEYKSNVDILNGNITFDIKPFEIKSFAIELESNNNDIDELYKTLDLEYNTNGITNDESKVNVILQGSGCSLPQELLDREIKVANIPFKIENKNLSKNMVVMRDQTIKLPEGSKKLYMIAASTLGNRKIAVKCDNIEKSFTIDDMKEPYGSWDMVGLNQTAYLKNSNVAMVFTHTHHPSGNLTNEKAYFYLYELDVRNCNSITLPSENRAIIMAMTISFDANETKLVTNINDDIDTKYEFKKLPPIDKIVDKAKFATIKAGEVQKALKKDKFNINKKSNILKNIIKSIHK